MLAPSWPRSPNRVRCRSGRGGLPDRDDAPRGLALTNLLDLKTDFAYWNSDLQVEAVSNPSVGSTRLNEPDCIAGSGDRGGGLRVRHYLDLADARTLPTPTLVAVHRAIGDLLGAAAMGVVHGMAGLG